MSTSRIKRGFSVVELLTVIVVLGALIVLLLPTLASSAADARRVTCQNKLQQIGLGALNYESGKRRFPVVSFNLSAAAPSADRSRPASTNLGTTTGYSWIVQALPLFEETNLYRDILGKSKRFAIGSGPFDPGIVPGGNVAQHASCVPLSLMICPDWAGNEYTHKNRTIDAGRAANPDEPADQGAPEYAGVDSGMPGNGENSFKGKVAPTCYKPFVGTHMVKGMPIENGGMTLAGKNGLALSDFTDGTSKTFLLSESKECGYASWYDGTLNWLVGNDPNQPAPGNDGKPPWTNAAPALNKGHDPKVAKSAPYLKKSESANQPQNDVWWGPSSDHAKGIVYHVFVDGHVVGITDACDPATYLKLITRAGAEPIDDTKIR
jgi:type II secretory pathway pseudopilin PulG